MKSITKPVSNSLSQLCSRWDTRSKQGLKGALHYLESPGLFKSAKLNQVGKLRLLQTLLSLESKGMIESRVDRDGNIRYWAAGLAPSSDKLLN